ncbi:MAG: O-antigen ligase family protein [Steroidobacteraceae bacterium]
MSLTAIIFLLCFLVGLGMAFFRHPIYGLYTYIAVFYLDAPHRWWGEGLPDLRWSMTAAIVTALAMTRLKADPNRTPWYKTFPAKILIAYTIWLWIQSPWALDPVLHRECALIFTKFIIVYYMVYRLIDTPLLTADFLLAHVLGSCYLGLVALGTGTSGGRLDGVGGPGIDDSNTLGMHAATAAVVGAMLIFAKRDWRRYAALVSVPLILNLVVLTGSRGAFLALFMGGLVIFALRPKENARLFYTLAVLGILGFGAVASETFWERMQTMEAAVNKEETLDGSAEGRILQMKAGLIMFGKHPLGVGHRGFAALSAQYLDPIYLTETGERSSHNTFISTLVEQGVPGAFLFSILWLWVLKSCLAARRAARANRPLLEASVMAAVCGGLVVVFIGGQFADFLKAEVQVWLFALLAGLAAVPRLKKTAGHRPRARLTAA